MTRHRSHREGQARQQRRRAAQRVNRPPASGGDQAGSPAEQRSQATASSSAPPAGQAPEGRGNGFAGRVRPAWCSLAVKSVCATQTSLSARSSSQTTSAHLRRALIVLVRADRRAVLPSSPASCGLPRSIWPAILDRSLECRSGALRDLTRCTPLGRRGLRPCSGSRRGRGRRGAYGGVIPTGAAGAPRDPGLSSCAGIVSATSRGGLTSARLGGLSGGRNAARAASAPTVAARPPVPEPMTTAARLIAHAQPRRACDRQAARAEILRRSARPVPASR